MDAEIKLLASNGERQENYFQGRLKSQFPTINLPVRSRHIT